MTLIIAIFIIALLFGIVLLGFTGFGSPAKKEKKLKIQNELKELNEMVKSRQYESKRDTIIRFDTLLSKALQYKHNNDSSCGENLKQSSDLFDRDFYNRIWEFHKLRNKVVHDNIDISEQELDESSKVFTKAIYKLIA